MYWQIGLFFLCSSFLVSQSLDCYSGFTYLRGQSVGTTKMTCDPGEYCYNITYDLTNLNKLSKAGCSSTRCFIAHNKCITQSLFGETVQFCCCNNGDFCNSRSTNASLTDRVKNKAKDVWDAIKGFG